MQDSPILKEKKLWFRAKRYGYGWYPSTWQGWGVLGLYFVWIFKTALNLNHQYVGTDGIFNFLTDILIPTIFLIIICYTRGEEARWRWGK